VRRWQLGAAILAAIVLQALIYRGFEVQTTPNYGDELALRRISARPWPQLLTHYQPLVPAVLKCLHAAFGREWLIRFAQLQELLFVAAALLAGWLALRATGRPWAGIAALVAVLADVRLGIYQYWALTEILTLFLSLAACAALAAHAMRTHWPAAALAATALALLVFLRSQNVFVLASFLAVSALLGRGARDWMRRSAPVLAAGALMLAWVGYKQYSGAQIYSQSGFSLYFVLMHHKGLLARMPAEDPDLAPFRHHFAPYVDQPASNDFSTLTASDLALPTSLGGIWAPDFNRAVRKAYVHVLLHHPVSLLGTALRSFWTEQTSAFLPPYPEDANLGRDSPGFAVASRLSAILFAPITNVLTTLGAAVVLLVLLARVAVPRFRAAGVRGSGSTEILALLCAWTVTDAAATSLFFFPFWPPDTSRMRLHYEAQASVTAIICIACIAAAISRARSLRSAAALARPT
jgi:hypothetical protein